MTWKTLGAIRLFLAGGSQLSIQNIITSRALRFPWTWSLYTIAYSLAGNCRTFDTQTSCDEEESTSGSLNQIIASIDRSPNSSSDISYSYFEKLCKAGNLSVAAMLMQSLHERQIRISPKVYNLFLAAASEKNDINLTLEVFKDLLVSCESLNSTSYFIFARAFIGTNDCVQILKWIDELELLTFPRSVRIFNQIIFAFAECGQIDKAVLIFEKMKTLKCKADLCAYNTILDALGRVGRVEEMLDEFASMKEAGIVPDIISYNTLLKNLRKIGRLDMCLVYFKEMGKSGILPDLYTYSALIEGFGRAGNIEESLRLFSEMKMRQIHPTVYIYRSLIHNLKKMGKVDLAMTLLGEMNSAQTDPVGPDKFRQKRRNKRRG